MSGLLEPVVVPEDGDALGGEEEEVVVVDETGPASARLECWCH